MFIEYFNIKKDTLIIHERYIKDTLKIHLLYADSTLTLHFQKHTFCNPKAYLLEVKSIPFGGQKHTFRSPKA